MATKNNEKMFKGKRSQRNAVTFQSWARHDFHAKNTPLGAAEKGGKKAIPPPPDFYISCFVKCKSTKILFDKYLHLISMDF